MASKEVARPSWLGDSVKFRLYDVISRDYDHDH